MRSIFTDTPFMLVVLWSIRLWLVKQMNNITYLRLNQVTYPHHCNIDFLLKTCYDTYA